MVNGKPSFEIDLSFSGIIAETLTDIQFAGKEENVVAVEKALEEHIQKQCEDLIYDLQNKYRVDAILLGKYARAKWPPLVKEQDWDEVFCESDIKVNVNVTIQGTGEVA
ncbi:hypothetical protein N752_18240 [Desulforamulus aquiferis]|nr:Ger(x)C family spore germination C-terminal domain-containing protein [Desulforamulus aquiferis]RYD03688.1 hypothetical protein N752_18240 [Desulforamulus aquiferis]